MATVKWAAAARSTLTAMMLNRLETMLVNNPVRSLSQRRFEARRLLRMGGRTPGAHVLEVGCGRGVGIDILFDQFGAARVDAFDLDPRMIELAKERLAARRDRVRLHVGDVTSIPAEDATYDAVFDFGALHHAAEWRPAVAEIARVLKPGGRFYAEDVLKPLLGKPLFSRLLEGPRHDRFDDATFRRVLEEQGLRVIAHEALLGWFGWYVAERSQAPGE